MAPSPLKPSPNVPARMACSCGPLTDHDEIGGQHRAAAAAREQGMKYVTGTEISVTFIGTTVHIVGLGFNPDDPRMKAGLNKTRGGRRERAMEMADGWPGSGSRVHLKRPEICRQPGPDLAHPLCRFLVETGVCKDTNEVFRKYLTEGKPGYVEHKWANLREAVTWITQAGGIAVIAHPARYKFSTNEEFALFTEFKALAAEPSRWSPAATRRPSM